MEEFSSYEKAVSAADQRASHSYFDHYVVTHDEWGFVVMNEGDYGRIPEHYLERIAYCAEAGLIDEY